MQTDHIFIFSNHQGKEADELIHFGLTEGSSRIHPGQGTRNRKFYFQNFFLEIAWVYNRSEIKSPTTAPTKLWERANHQINGSSPFGLCLVHTTDTDKLFEGCLKYQPDYLPNGHSFDIITNKEHPYLPWTCRLPSTLEHTAQEPKHHPSGIERLTKVTFGIPSPDFLSRFTEIITSSSNIRFQKDVHHSLTLTFDRARQGKVVEFRELPLVIEY